MAELFILGKQAKQKATYPGGYEANKAVDGVYIPPSLHDSIAVIDDSAGPWWRVDLGQVYCIWAIRLLNRPGLYKIYMLHAKCLCALPISLW